MGKKIVFYLLLVICNTAVAQKNISHWIATSEDSLTKPNTWHCFRKTFDLSNIPKQAALSIATDTKYWLWINGRLIVYEGGIKRGPNPFDTYYDRVDVAPFLKRGSNVIAVLVWFWGGKGFSHKNSGRSALWAECSDIGLRTDLTWKAIVHPAYGPSKLPNPNFRLSEPNIFYDARNEFVTTDNSMWFDTKFTDKQWTKAKFAGNVNDYPWHKLVLRPIPLFKFHKPKEYINVSYIRCKDQDTIVAKLPYNGHFSPILKVNAPAGRRIVIASDTYYLGSLSAQDSLYTLASEYITRNGEQSYESYLWLSGHEIRYVIPKDVKVLSLAYRETGYNASFSGSFLCNDSLLNKLWKKAQRTLYVNMRDNYMDCPDRERAQWAGDGAMEMAQAFYALDTNSYSLGRKLFLDLVNWQRADSTIYNPVPEENWKLELPVHSLMPLSEVRRFFNFTNDTATVRIVYPALKRYLAKWKQKDSGEIYYRKGGWDWGDWGENQDYILIQHGWYLKTLQTAKSLAELLKLEDDVIEFNKSIVAITRYLNSDDCWNGTAYRHKNYTGKTDDRANALMVLTHVADSSKWDRIKSVFKEQEHASPWMEKFVLESLFKMNAPQQALDRMRKRFKAMTASDLSTLWELWHFNPKEARGNSGYNHGWAGGPLVLLTEFIAGVKPSTESADTYLISPLTTDIKNVNATIPTRKGVLAVDINQGDSEIQMKVVVPKGLNAAVRMPRNSRPYRQVLVNGNKRDYSSDRKDATILLGPGNHTIKANYQ